MKDSTLYSSEQRLIEAIDSCRIYQTRQLLEDGTCAEFKDEEGYSPLLRACLIGDDRHRTRTSLLKLLIEYGADVNTVDPRGRHALAYACINDKKSIVRLLLDASIHDIDLNKKDNDGDTPLIHAVRMGNVNLVRILVRSMNKFQINMDVRNNADRTPYLEAKHLGKAECASVLLGEGHASTDVQANPFLEFTDQEKNQKKYRHGEVRGVGVARRLYDADQKTYRMTRSRRVKSAKSTSKRDLLRDHNHCSGNTRLLKRKCKSPRALIKNTEGKQRQETTESTAHVLREIQVSEETSKEFGSDGPLSSSVEQTKGGSCLVTDQNIHEISEPPVRRVRPLTALTTRKEFKEIIRNRENIDKNSVTSSIFLTDGIPVVVSGQRGFSPRHPQNRTAPHRHFTSVRHPLDSRLSSENTKSECSTGDFTWYSHFSINTSPSVNFLNKIMTLYGEQFSPESSYRKGVKPRQPEDYAPSSPTIVEPPSDVDKHSDGRRSSSGSVRSQSGRNRKFAAVTRTVAMLSGKKPVLPVKTKS